MANSFETTVATPSKWPGRDRPLPAVAHPAHRHRRRRGRGPGRVHLRDGRDEHDVGAGLGAHEEVTLERPRVARHVLGVAELQRVDEDADGDQVALGAGTGDQGDVPVVQRAHGRHQPDRAPGRTRPVQRVAAAAGGLHDVHRRGRPTPPPARPARGRRIAPAVSPGPPRPGSPGRSPSGSASRWRLSVAQSPRRAGPVSAAPAPSAATSSTAALVSGRNDSRSSPT